MAADNNASDLDEAIFAGAEGYDDLDDAPRPDTSDTFEPEPEEAKPEPEAETTDTDDAQGEADDSGDDADVAPTVDAEGETDSDNEPKPQDAKPQEPRIPKNRFDEVNERRKKAEQRLAELEGKNKQQQEPTVDFDFEAKEDAYMDAVLDGDKQEARNIRQEIRQAEKQLYEQQMRQASTSTREETKAELELQSTINELQTQYPVFDGNSDNYDQNLTEEALELFEGFKAQKYDPATAMRRAVRYVARANQLDAQGNPVETPAEEPKAQHKAEPEAGRKKVKRQAKQPPQPDPRQVSDAPDPMSMSEDEFDKLSDQELAKIRGDLNV